MNDKEIPSRETRNAKLAAISQESALFALNKAKSLVMTFWRGGSIATTMSVASFFGVSEKTIRGLVDTYRDELIADGLRLVTGSELQDVSRTLRLTSGAPKLSIWTPRAILRLGMVLRDSSVAKQVRTVLLDQVERNPNPKQLGLDPDPWGEDDRPADRIPNIERPTLADKAANDVFAMLFGGETDPAPVAKAPAPNQKILDGINYVLAHSNLTKVQRAILEDLLQP